MSSAIRVQRVPGICQIPTAADAIEAARSVWSPGSKGWSPYSYFGVIQLLMLAGFCFCLTVQAQGQIVVEVVPQLEVIVQKPQDAEPEQDEEFSLVLCTASWCGPCRAFKASSEYSRISKRYRFETADIDKRPAWIPYAPRLPTVWLIRKSDRSMLRSWQGAVTLQTIDAEVERQKVKARQ